MKTRTFSSERILRNLATITLTFLLTVQAASGQWLNGWSYRVPVSIDNSTGSALTDYQVKVSLNSNIWQNVNADGSDIRFTALDGSTLLPYWIETWTYGSASDIWVKVPSVEAGSTGTIYMYYGNANATDNSSGTNTFEFFDDFESGLNPGPGTAPNSGWQDLTDIPVPTSDATIAVYNDKLYVFGGYGIDHVILNITYEYDPSTGIWASKANMPTERWGMIAVEFNGLIYVFGGTANSGVTRAVEVYDPAEDSWTTRASLPDNIFNQGLMGVKFGDKIHLFYGAYHYEYDPATDTYLQKYNIPSGRTWGTCAVVNNRIYLIGGYNNGGTNTNQVLDPVNDTWSTAAPLPVSIYGATRESPVIDGKIHVTHGWNNVYFYTTNFMYDPETNTWSQRGSANHARDGVACGVVSNKLYVVGGRNVMVNTFGLPYHEVYDPSADPYNVELSNKWSISNASYVSTSEVAKSAGDYGLLMSANTSSGPQFAESVETFGSNYILDFDWNVKSDGGVSGSRPEVQVRLSEYSYAGNFYNYNVNGTQELRWLSANSTLNYITNSPRDSWHKVSMSRNGSNRSIVFDGVSYGPYNWSEYSLGTGKFRFRIVPTTIQYIDNVRVRKWVATQPVVSLGSAENIEWTGAVSNSWTEPGNWSTGFVPESHNDVVIPAGATNDPEISGTVSINSMVVDPSANVTVLSEGNLNAATITINSSDTQHNGSLKNLGSVTGTVIYNRYLLPKASGGDWQLISSPVANNTSDNVDDISRAKAWDELTGAWNNGSGMINLPRGRGYNLKQIETGDGIVTFTGELLEDVVTVDVTSPFQNSYDGSAANYLRGYADGTGNSGIIRDGDALWGGGGWNLLGNPFTSALSVSRFIDQNDGTGWTDNQFDPSYVALYIHDGAAYQGTSPTYKFVSLSTGWEDFVGGEHINAENIQVGQGFFVLAMNDASTFTFTRDMQEHDGSIPLLKSARSDERWPGLKLSIKAGSVERSTLIVYGENMTVGLDPAFDVGQYANYSELEIYTTLAGQDNGVNFARQALPMADYSTIKTPVGIDFETGGSVSFSAESVPVGSNKFWLEDRTTGIFTDLSTKSYTVTLPAGTYGTGRFYIIASANTPTAVNDTEEDDNGLRIWVSNNKAVIKGAVSEKALCEIFSVNGKRILERRLNDSDLNTVDLPSGLKGLYLIRITDGAISTTRKVALL